MQEKPAKTVQTAKVSAKTPLSSLRMVLKTILDNALVTAAVLAVIKP